MSDFLSDNFFADDDLLADDLLADDDLFADDLFADDRDATVRRTNYRIRRKRRMPQSVKNKRKRTRRKPDSVRKRQNKERRRKRRTDRSYRKNLQDYQNAWNKKNRKKPNKKKPSRNKPSRSRGRSRRRASIGYSLPFNLEFLYEGKASYLMSLSEMFDAVNIYVEGETAIVVDLNDFLDRAEWYEEEDMELFFDLIEESYAVLDEDPQDAWSEFTLEERDPPAKRNIDKKSSICDRTDNLAILQMILAVLRGAHFSHWTSHWQVRGLNSYSDHDLMERVYNTLIKEIDTLAEKIVGTYGVKAVNAVEQAQLMANHLLPLAEAHSMNDPIRRALLIEEGLQVVFKNAYGMLKSQGGLTLGMDDFIMSMANTHDTSLYLLRQRCDSRPSVRMAFNKYNPTELIGQLMSVLNKNGLEDTVSELKTMKVPQIVDKAWREREK